MTAVHNEHAYEQFLKMSIGVDLVRVFV